MKKRSRNNLSKAISEVIEDNKKLSLEYAEECIGHKNRIKLTEEVSKFVEKESKRISDALKEIEVTSKEINYIKIPLMKIHQNENYE